MTQAAATAFAATIDPRQHIAFLNTFKRVWQREMRAELQLSSGDWDNVMNSLNTIAQDFYMTVLKLRIEACIRRYFLDAHNPQRTQRLQRDLLFYKPFITRSLYPEGYGDNERKSEEMAWAENPTITLPNSEYWCSSDWFTYAHDAYETPLQEARMYWEWSDATDRRHLNARAIVTFIAWIYLCQFLNIVVWNSTENINAMAAVQMDRPETVQEIYQRYHEELPPVHNSLPYIIQKGNTALDKDLYRQRLRALEARIGSLRHIRAQVLEGDRTVRNNIRAQQRYISQCRNCRNTDMIDAVTLSRISPHHCWQAPNGICWDLRTLRTMYNQNPTQLLPDRSGPLPVHILQQQAELSLM